VLGAQAYGRLARDERTVVERNLARVRGGSTAEVPSRSVDRVFASYGRYWLESLRLPHVEPAEIEARFTHEGIEHLLGPIGSGGTPILALPHVGGWEWAAAWLTQVRGWRVTAVAERLEPPELFEWFCDYRARLGVDVVPLGPNAAAELARSIEPNRIITLLADRDLTGDGVPVEFFGERTTLPGGPALLALRSGMPLLPTAVYQHGPHHHAVVRPPLDTERRGRLRADVARVTQDLAHAFEELIAAQPEQWHLLQPNWPSDRAALGEPVEGSP
jgi:KDO2-lipid IV(A) lauroyltransferase